MNDVDIELLRSYAEGANDGVEMMRLYSETLARVDSLETLAERLETENERLREVLEKVVAADDDLNDEMTYICGRLLEEIKAALRREDV